MKKRIFITLVVAFALLGAIFGYKFFTISKAQAAQAGMMRPPTTVSAAETKAESWPNSLNAVGSFASFQGVMIKNEIEGRVRRIAIESGALVAEGALLVELDTSVETAQLAGLEAQAKLAGLTLVRARELRTNGTNTQADLDTAEALSSQAIAAADQLRAVIAKKKIVAPFAGRLGITKIYPGQYLGGGEAIVQIETLDPIYIDFSLPQKEVARVAVGQTVQITVDARPGQPFEGKITAISPRVSDATHSINLRATLANGGELLRPGMFARVEVILPATENYLVLPGAAIVYSPYGNTVFVVEKGIVHQRFVQTGPQRGDLIAIISGLKAGEQVVTSGQIKLRNESPVRIDNSITPGANPAPKPDES